MIKLIVSDLDGTLFDENHQLNEVTAAAIRKANSAGIRFMVATGRGKGNVLPYFEKAGIACAKILVNGAMFLNEKNELEHSVPMKHEDVRMLYDLIMSYDIALQIFYSEGVACTDPEKMKQEFKQRLKEKLHMEEETLDAMIREGSFCRFDHTIDDLDAFLHAYPMVYKLEAFVNDEHVVREIREKLKDMKHVEVSNSVADNIEITDTHAQKGWMLEKVLKRMGLTKDEVVTIGDSMNDMTMISGFPNSYAMGNACEDIKRAAVYQAPFNYENGVARVIEDILAGRHL